MAGVVLTHVAQCVMADLASAAAATQLLAAAQVEVLSMCSKHGPAIIYYYYDYYYYYYYGLADTSGPQLRCWLARGCSSFDFAPLSVYSLGWIRRNTLSF